MNKNEMREIAKNLTDKFFETNSRKIVTDYKTFANTEI